MFRWAHLKPASILLDEIIIHSTDHPLVFIQDLCLQLDNHRLYMSILSLILMSVRCVYLLDACWSTSQFSLPVPLFGRIQSGRPSGRRTGCAPAAWGRTSRIHRPCLRQFTEFVWSFCHGLPISKWLTLGLSFQKKKTKYSRVFLISTLSSVRSVPSTVLENHFLSSSVDNNTDEQSGGLLQKPHLQFALNLCKKMHFWVSARDAAAVFLFWRVSAAIAARAEKQRSFVN